MKKRQLFIIFIVLCMMFTLVSCKKNCGKNPEKEKDMLENIPATLEELTQTSMKITMTDHEVVVYEYEKTIKFGKTVTNVIVSESVLNDKAELQTTSDQSQVSNVKKSELFGLKIDKKLFSNLKESETEISFDVANDKMLEVFKGNDMKAQGSAHFVITFENKKIKAMECTYTTTSSRQVVITCSYVF